MPQPDSSEYATFPDMELKRGMVLRTVDGEEGQYQNRTSDGKLLIRTRKGLIEVDQADVLPPKF